MTEGKPGLKLLKSELLAGAFLRRNELTVNKQLVLAELNKNSLGREWSSEVTLLYELVSVFLKDN